MEQQTQLLHRGLFATEHEVIEHFDTLIYSCPAEFKVGAWVDLIPDRGQPSITPEKSLCFGLFIKVML